MNKIVEALLNGDYGKAISLAQRRISELEAEIDSLKVESDNRKWEIWIRKIWVEHIQFCSPTRKHYEYIPPEDASDD